jgi:fumagillin biosynthesis cytochrome P450 monooxygenase
LKIIYGYNVEPHSVDPLVKTVEKMVYYISNTFRPLVWIVDVFPWVRYLPEGWPGTSYRETAREVSRINSYVADAPYNLARKQYIDGTHRPSYVSALIQKLSGSGPGSGDFKLSAADEDTIKNTAAIMYAGGADTSVASITSFVLAMIKYPDVQRKAQQEIDDVIGTHRLPGFADRPRLPYINAVIKESLRWYPIVPTNASHRVNEDFNYAGYKIPKGSIILASAWWFLHDPNVYMNPLAFEPERFLEPRNEPEPVEIWGYGRRICPGRFLADANIFITAVRLLSAFNIKKAVDSEGQLIDPKVEYMPGSISRPTPFPYKMECRSKEHAAIIRSIEVEHPWESGDADLLEKLS